MSTTSLDAEPGSPQQGDGDGASPAGPADRRFALAAKLALIAIGVIGLVILLYALSAQAVPGNSDGATVLLEGQSIQAGHLTLNGWFLSYDSFWLTDALVNAVAVLIVGVHGGLLNLVPALIATGVIVLGVVIARADRRGVAANAGAVTVIALLGLPVFALAVFFLQGPLHVGTALWCLGAIVLLQFPGRWRFVLGVVLLAMAIDGDLQAIAFGAVPVAAAGVLDAARRRSPRRAILPIVAAGASVVLALIVRELAKLIGTFVVNSPNATASGHELVHNARLTITYLFTLLGPDTHGTGSGGVPRHLEDVHVIGTALVLLAVLFALGELIVGFVRRPPDDESGRCWRIDDALVIAFLADVLVFIKLTPLQNVSYARYLTAAVIFGAILAGRLVARVVAALGPGALRRVLLGAGVVVIACFAAGTGETLSQPVGASPPVLLAEYLSNHHLTLGLGDYWSASIVTAQSGERVTVRPVTAPQGRVVEYERNSERAWYGDTRFQFLVFNSAFPFGGVDIESSIAAFGPTATRTYVDGYIVLTWHHRVRVAGAAS